ncbi:MAG: hypothetical protein QW478_12565 [Candidatus Micrarchaeaceae archaeon]
MNGEEVKIEGHNKFVLLVLVFFAIAVPLLIVLDVVFGIHIISEIGDIIFFVAVFILFIYLITRNSLSFGFVRLHPILTGFIILGLAVTSGITGIASFFYSLSAYTIGNFVHVLLNVVLISQTAQSQAVAGGFSIIGFFFGILWMISLVLFFYDLLLLLVHNSLAHSLFPMKIEITHYSVTTALLLIALGIYVVLIWASSAVTGTFQINPLFGTVQFITAVVHGKVSISFTKLLIP